MRFAASPCLVAAFLIGTPVAGQQPAAPADCRALIKQVRELEPLPQMTIEDLPDGCRVTNVVLGMNDYARYAVDEVTLLVPDLLEAWPSGQPFAQAELTATGIRLAPETGSPLQNYIFQLQARPFDVHLAYRWDSATGTLDLADLTLSGGQSGGISLSARLSGLPEITLQTMDVAAFTASFDHLRIGIEDGDLFTNFVVVPLLNLLPYEEDPRPQITAFQQVARSTIQAQPSDRLSDESKAALLSLVDAFPRPDGSYVIDINAEPPLPLAELIGLGPAEIAAMASRLSLVASRAGPAPDVP